MHDEPRVRVADRATHLNHQLHSGSDSKLVCVAIFVNLQAINPFHHQIVEAGFGGPAFQETGNRRMFEVGEDLSFGEKTASPRFAVEGTWQNLDRHLFAIGAIVSFAGQHNPHAAAAQLANNAIRSNLLTNAYAHRRFSESCRDCTGQTGRRVFFVSL